MTRAFASGIPASTMRRQKPAISWSSLRPISPALVTQLASSSQVSWFIYRFLQRDQQRASILMRGAGGGGALSHHHDRQNGGDEDDSEQGETIGVAHDRRLRADRLADGDDGAVPCAARARKAVRHEVALQFGEASAGRRFEQRHMPVDDEGME